MKKIACRPCKRRGFAGVLLDLIVQSLRRGESALRAQIVVKCERDGLTVKVSRIAHKIGFHRDGVFCADRRADADICYAGAYRAVGQKDLRGIHAALGHDDVGLRDEVCRREKAFSADALSMLYYASHEMRVPQKFCRAADVARFDE